MMAQEETKKRDHYTGPGRHPLSERATTRFLRTLPAFRVVHDIPDHLSELLKRLEEAEQNGQEKGRA